MTVRLTVLSLTIGAALAVGCNQREPDAQPEATVRNQEAPAPVTVSPEAREEARAAASEAAEAVGTAVDKTQVAAQEAAAVAKQGAKSAAEAVTDAAITAEVKTALAADARLSALRIDVDTRNGVVSLTGPAPDEATRRRAGEMVKNLKGVARVENNLKVGAS